MITRRAFLASAGTAVAQTPENSQESYLRLHYIKQEQMIPMRDGVKLFTSIYVPRDNPNEYVRLKRFPPGFFETMVDGTKNSFAGVHQ